MPYNTPSRVEAADLLARCERSPPPQRWYDEDLTGLWEEPMSQAKWTALDAAMDLFQSGVFGRGFRPSEGQLREVAERIEVAGAAYARQSPPASVTEEREACAATAEGLAGEYPPQPGDGYFGQGWDDAVHATARAIRERK